MNAKAAVEAKSADKMSASVADAAAEIAEHAIKTEKVHRILV